MDTLKGLATGSTLAAGILTAAAGVAKQAFALAIFSNRQTDGLQVVTEKKNAEVEYGCTKLSFHKAMLADFLHEYCFCPWIDGSPARNMDFLQQRPPRKLDDRSAS